MQAKQEYLQEGVVIISPCGDDTPSSTTANGVDSVNKSSVDKVDKSGVDGVVEEKVAELTDVLNSMLSRIAKLESHTATLFSYIGQQINGNAFDLYVIKCKERLTEKNRLDSITLREKEAELNRVIQEEKELGETLDELDNALKSSDFPLQIAAIINDRKNSIMDRIKGLHGDKLKQEVAALQESISTVSQKISTLSNFVVDE